MRGIYLHIPFCVRKCAYCDFYSVAAGKGEHEAFCALLSKEMSLLLREFPGETDVPVDTVYFGGGTPTVLGPERLCRLLSELREQLPVVDGAEVTLEANPGTVSGRDFERLVEGGFNRVSLGAQSFRPTILSTLGRIHSTGEIASAFRAAREAGFASVGIDLIFGSPGQEADDWAGDLEQAVALAPDHLSAYALSPEPGTPLQQAIEEGTLTLPADDAVARMYSSAREALAASGYLHYEISNFARPGLACRHNLKYWRREEYLGLGPSAHGMLFPSSAPLGLRTANPPSLRDYTAALRSGRLPWTQVRRRDREDAWKEAVIFGLRTEEGISPGMLSKRYGPPPEEVREAVEALLGSGALRREGDRVLLPKEYWFISNEILRRFA